MFKSQATKPSGLKEALEKHNGDLVAVTLEEPFTFWPMADTVRLLAMLLRELAQKEKARREAANPEAR